MFEKDKVRYDKELKIYQERLKKEDRNEKWGRTDEEQYIKGT